MKNRMNFSLKQLHSWAITFGLFFFALSCDKKDTEITPVANFTFEADADNPLKISFTNTSTNSKSYSWDFGDSKGTSTEKSPTYTYGEAGTFTVKLTVTSETGQTNAKSKEVIVKDTEITPVANFTFEADADNPLKISFTNTSTNSKSYSWDFGDSKGTSTEKSPTYTYGEAGTFTVKLTVTSETGQTNAKSKEVIVKDTEITPVANFTFEADADNPLKISFTNTSTNSKSYSWDFGDSKGTSTEESPVHTYADFRSYEVKLTATGADDATNVATQTVTLVDPTIPTEPTVAAPAPTVDKANVISLYSDQYTDLPGTSFIPPDMTQKTTYSEDDIDGNKMIKITGFNIIKGYNNTTKTDISSYSYVHIDYWTPDLTKLRFSLISKDPSLEDAFVLEIKTGEWNSVDIPLTHFTDDKGDDVVDLSKVFQMKLDNEDEHASNPKGTEGTIFIDNIYFHK